MITLILIICILILIQLSLLTYWRWKERSLNTKLESIILSVPKVETAPLKVREIVGEVVPGSYLEEGELDEDRAPVEVREWENEQRWLNRRKQRES